MSAAQLDGKLVAYHLQQILKKSIDDRMASGKRPPGLAAICVGKDPASMLYVANKRKLALNLGFASFAYDLPHDTSESILLTLIDKLNASPEIDGILVQLPLPTHIDPTRVLEHIDPKKDIDGFHPYNLGCLAQGHPRLRPCTPFGIMQLLAYYKLPVVGKHAVVIGASTIVGRPMALELLLAKATVTVCHRATLDLELHVRQADLLIVATGSPHVIQTHWLHSKQIVIDVGIHRKQDGRIHGDIDLADAQQRVAWITPVPGGVGPMTVITLLQNTFLAAKT